MVHITNTLDTQNLKEHCNSIVTNTLDTQNTLVNKHTQNLKEHCNGIVNKHAGYTESKGALQWYS